MKRSLAFAVLCWLQFMRVSRLMAQADNDLGYRYSLYVEDGDRMKVNTHSVLWDVGAGDNVRVTGNFVLDTISGATPTGAPPQTRWPFATFNDIYHQNYAAAYAGYYSQSYNTFINNNQIYVGSLLTEQQLTNLATQFALGQVGTIATNAAAAQYGSLTNNPAYRRNQVPVTELHDRRAAFSLGLPVTVGRHEITPSFSYSTESDYISTAGALNYALALNNKNTILSAGWAHDGDSVRDDRLVWEPKTTDDAFVGLTQLINPKAYLTVNASLSVEHGYLADPYRGVMPAMDFPQFVPDDASLIPEKRPRHRLSEILYTSWTQFITPLDGSLEPSFRFFHDSYGIFANTAELAWHQKIGKRIVVTPDFRYYIQNSANFYYVLVPDYDQLPAYYSSDYRLSEFQSFSTGLTVTWRVTDWASLDMSYTRYIMQGLDGVTSQSAYPSANIFSIGFRLWF